MGSVLYTWESVAKKKAGNYIYVLEKSFLLVAVFVMIWQDGQIVPSGFMGGGGSVN